MSDIKDELIKVKILKEDDDGVVLECTIKKIVMIKMFDSYDFQRQVNSMLAEKLVKEMPIAQLNELRKLIDLEVVAKLATVSMSDMIANRDRR